MEQSEKLYLSEFAVSLCSARWLITSASQLMSGKAMRDEVQEVANNSYI